MICILQLVDSGAAKVEGQGVIAFEICKIEGCVRFVSTIIWSRPKSN